MKKLREYARALTPREIATTYRWAWQSDINGGDPFWDGFFKAIIRMGPMIVVVEIILILRVII